MNNALGYTVHQPGIGYTVHQPRIGRLRTLGQGLVSPGTGGVLMVGMLLLGVTAWAAWFLATKPRHARA